MEELFQGNRRKVGEIENFDPQGDVFVNVNNMCLTMTVRDQKCFYLVKLNNGKPAKIGKKVDLEENSLMLTQCRKYVFPKVVKKIKGWYICDIE